MPEETRFENYIVDQDQVTEIISEINTNSFIIIERLLPEAISEAALAEINAMNSGREQADAKLIGICFSPHQSHYPQLAIKLA